MHLDLILSTLREEAGSTGQIVAVIYYALDYADPATANTLILNSRIVRAALANGAGVASGFLAFLPTAIRAEGNSPTPAWCCRTTRTSRPPASGCSRRRWSGSSGAEPAVVAGARCPV